MQARLMTILATLAAISGCATTSNTYLVERDTLIDGNGIYVYGDLEENSWDGARHRQYRAANHGDYPFCVQVSLNQVQYTSGHEMGHIHYISPGETRDIGYVQSPANFTINVETWAPKDNGSC